ncbi:MAG TPA: DUF2383 domain-containing protein [Chthoniobacterales bacterium]|jgi:hypothetical protein
MTTNPTHCINTCNALLRGERSAVETYGKAIEKYHDRAEVSLELERIREQHASSARLLEENVREMGGEPDADAGAWGAFATAIQSTANLFGEGSALESLKSGESAGRGDYEKSLEDEDVLPECKELIRSRLLPPVLANITALERLQQTA